MSTAGKGSAPRKNPPGRPDAHKRYARGWDRIFGQQKQRRHIKSLQYNLNCEFPTKPCTCAITYGRKD